MIHNDYNVTHGADTILESRKGASTTILVQLGFEFPDLRDSHHTSVILSEVHGLHGTPSKIDNLTFDSTARLTAQETRVRTFL